MVLQRPGFVEPCLPSKAARPPSGPLWVHEIKHDGYRLMVRWDGSRVRRFTRNGYYFLWGSSTTVTSMPTVASASFRHLDVKTGTGEPLAALCSIAVSRGLS
jgi:hypothetical protein